VLRTIKFHTRRQVSGILMGRHSEKRTLKSFPKREGSVKRNEMQNEKALKRMGDFAGKRTPGETTNAEEKTPKRIAIGHKHSRRKKTDSSETQGKKGGERVNSARGGRGSGKKRKEDG